MNRALMMSQSSLGEILPRTLATFKPFLVTTPSLRPNPLTFDFLALSSVSFQMSLQFLLSGEGSVTAHTEVVSLMDLSPVAAPGRGGWKGGLTGGTDEGFVQLASRADRGGWHC